MQKNIINSDSLHRVQNPFRMVVRQVATTVSLIHGLQTDKKNYQWNTLKKYSA